MTKTMLLAIGLMSAACASGAGRVDPSASLVSADRAMAQNAANKGLTAAFLEVLAYDGVQRKLIIEAGM